ncbi:MAG: IS630 family transposase [Waterburya sp.]
MTFLRNLRQIVLTEGSANLIYLDESGFEANTYRPYAWSKRGYKSYGERSGQRGTRTSLIAGKRGKQLLAPILFQGSTNALWFNQWLQQHLLPQLNPNSTLILDNAPFHRKDDVFRIAEQAGHKVLFLPPYSPDFNRIEQDFAIIKKRRIYSPPGTTLDDIIKSYGNYLE